MKRALLALLLCLAVTSTAFGAVFIVPDDAELVHKSSAIVLGRVASAGARQTADGVETVYRIHVDRSIKGLANGSIDVVSPGGESNGKFTLVPGAAHFKEGDEVLLFLVQHNGNWTTTDMTLGKFRAVTSTGGQSLLVRDEEDIVGFDRDLRPHVEKVRRREEFLRFVNDVVRGGRNAASNAYFVDPQETLALEEETGPKGFDVEANSSHASSSYAIRFNSSGTYYPGRWPSSRMSSSLARSFFKNSANNASGLGDGGVSQITSMLAAWTNDCPSAVNVTYGGTHANLKNPGDNINVVVYNDPGNHIANSWTGSGVIATAYMQGDSFHTFDGVSWVGLSDSDIVVQNGLTGAESFMNTAMTHETGHAIGLRHSNTHFDGTACQVSDECTSSAIMNSSVGTLYGFVPQTWDLTAIRKIYPHTCTTTTSVRYDHNGDGMADVYWRNVTTGQSWMYQMNGNLVTGLSVAADTNLSKVVVGIADFDGDGKSDVLWRNSSNGQILLNRMNGNQLLSSTFVYDESDLNWKVVAVGDFNGDGKADIYRRNDSTKQSWVWLMNGNVITISAPSLSEGNLSWQPVAVGDFNGDGRDDLFWRNSANGLNYIYQMNGTVATGVATTNESNLNWKVVGAGDFNDDGRDDILWRNDATGQNWMYRMNGGGSTTGLHINYETNLNWKVANVADFNGDGKDDILWRNEATGQNWMYRMNGNTIAASLSVQAEGNMSWKIQK